MLVSEVMLQQTPVARVLPRWSAFLERWPRPAALAAAPLAEVLREWQGLGYPRRARDLHRTAAVVAAGWPRDERGLRALPGVGAYTARALAVLSLGIAAPPPRDVNVARVAARAALGMEPGAVRAADVERSLTAGVRGLRCRDAALALFDLGATVCTARRPRCEVCPLRMCASRARLEGAAPQPAARRQGDWTTSRRRLRGAVLAAVLRTPDLDDAAVAAEVGAIAALHPAGAVAAVLEALRAEGLLAAAPAAG